MNYNNGSINNKRWNMSLKYCERYHLLSNLRVWNIIIIYYRPLWLEPSC